MMIFYVEIRSREMINFNVIIDSMNIKEFSK